MTTASTQRLPMTDCDQFNLQARLGSWLAECLRAKYGHWPFLLGSWHMNTLLAHEWLQEIGHPAGDSNDQENDR